MNKNEKNILLQSYKNILTVQRLGYNKDDSKSEIKNILVKLGLENEVVKIENENFYKINKLTSMQVEGYENLNDILCKYTNKVSNAEIIEDIFNSVEFELTEEHVKCSKACFNLINNL